MQRYGRACVDTSTKVRRPLRPCLRRPAAVARSCKVLADRDTAVKILTENAFDGQLTADALNR
jgi:hypothetical protein